MSKTDKAIHTIQHIDELSSRDRWINNINPLVKLFVVIAYITFTMATHKYDIVRVILLALVPVMLMSAADLRISDILKRLWIVFPIAVLMGLANLLTDSQPFKIGNITLRAGLISMITLSVKFIYAVVMAYIFAATTHLNKLCRELRRVHVPEIIVTQIMLTYRYLGLLIKEAGNVITAYRLRAPGQKGIHFKVCGSLTGQMLLKSFDRAKEIYESMQLRGY